MASRTSAVAPRPELGRDSPSAHEFPADQSPATPPDAVPVSDIPAVNVASVPQRSPLRYPGGKTWLIPHVRAWLASISKPPLLFEPFCGGATVALTAVMEDLAERCLLAEIDHDVAAFWHCALSSTDALCARVIDFDPTRRNVEKLANERPADLLDHGFRTLVLNRTRRGGILAHGASLTRSGENGKGVASRWYPATLAKRLRQIEIRADRIAFVEGDGMKLLESVALVRDAAVFVDPPYTAGGKRAGKRLYAHHDLDHAKLFEMLADSQCSFLMTYDMSPEILTLVRRHRFAAVRVAMKTSHHARMNEIVITRHRLFSDCQ